MIKHVGRLNGETVKVIGLVSIAVLRRKTNTDANSCHIMK